MKNTSLSQATPSTPEPTAPAPVPSRIPRLTTWPQRHPVVMFVLGLGLGILAGCFAVYIYVTSSGVLVLLCYGLLLVGLVISASVFLGKSFLWMGVGLVVGLEGGFPVSYFLLLLIAFSQ